MEYDEAVTASHVLIPTAAWRPSWRRPALPAGGGRYDRELEHGGNAQSGSRQIARDLEEILEHYGYQGESRTAGTTISTPASTGVTPGRSSRNLDLPTVLAVAALALLIGFTGYLIIYNVFQISVTNDIRFYGLLKTIGTTPRQLLADHPPAGADVVPGGHPPGAGGGLAGGRTADPVVIAQLNGVVSVVSVDPAIFLLAALFSGDRVPLPEAGQDGLPGVSGGGGALHTEAKQKKRGPARPPAGVSLSMARSQPGACSGSRPPSPSRPWRWRWCC